VRQVPPSGIRKFFDILATMTDVISLGVGEPDFDTPRSIVEAGVESLREGRTLHHDGMGHFGAGRVYVRSAPQGTGIIAGGPMRAVFESLGVADVVTKSVGTSNPYNMIRATFEALKDQTSPRSVAQRRGKKVSDLLGRGGMDKGEAEATAEAVTE